jgi:hypothetical protein
MKRTPVLVGIVFVLVVLAVLIYSSMNLAAHRVEVCITYHGQQACRTASGNTEEFARRAAITNTCSQIASGVTDSLQCENTPADRYTVLK